MPTEQKSDGPERRKAIISTATKLFLEKGFSGASMSDVASAAGMQKASLYHHFKSKEDLFGACVTHGYDQTVAELAEIEADDALSPPAKLRRVIAALYDITIERDVGRLSPLIAEVAMRFPQISETFFHSFIERQHRIIDAIVSEGVERGDFVARSAAGLKHMIFGPIVTLSLSKQMFGRLDLFDRTWPQAALQDDHIQAVLDLLDPAKQAVCRPSSGG